MRTCPIVLLLLLLQTNAFGQAAWKEYPFADKVLSLSSDGLHLYVGSPGNVMKLRMSNGDREYITPVNKPAFFSQMYQTRNVHSIAANPFRNEMYVGVDNGYRKMIAGTFMPVPLSTGGVEPDVARLGSDGRLAYSDGWYGFTVIDSTGSVVLNFNINDDTKGFDFDEQSRLWRVGDYVDSVAGIATALYGYFNDDTLTVSLADYAIGADGYGLAARNNHVYFHFKTDFPVTSDTWLLDYDVIANTITPHNIQGYNSNFTTPVGGGAPVIGQSNIAATAANLYMRYNDSTHAVVRKYTGGSSFTVLDSAAFGIQYKHILHIGSDFNDNVFIACFNENLKFVSWTTDGVTWSTASVTHAQVPNLDAYGHLNHWGNMVAHNDSALYVYNTFSRKVNRYADGVLTEQFDLSQSLPFTNNQLSATAISPDDQTYWVGLINNPANELKVVKRTSTGITTFIMPNVYNSSINWVDVQPTGFATNDDFWFRLGDSLIHVNAGGITALTPPAWSGGLSFGWLVNQDGKPVLLGNNTFDVYDGSAWQSQPLSTYYARILQRHDGLYILSKGAGGGFDPIVTFDGVTETPVYPLNFGIGTWGEFMKLGADDALYLGHAIMANSEIEGIVRIEPTFTSDAELITPPGTDMGDFAFLYYGFYPSGSKMMLLTDERYIVYDPLATPGTLEPDNLDPLNTVNGHVWYDYNANGLVDGADAHKLVYPLNHNGVAFTYYGSTFQFQVDTGFHFFTTQAEPGFHLDVDTLSVDFGTGYDSTVELTFRLLPDAGTHNLSVSAVAGPARPGFQHNVWLTAKNIAAEPVTATVTLDMNADFVAAATSTPVPDNTGLTTMQWNLSLAAGEQQDIAIHTTVPVSFAIGMPLVYTLNGTIAEPDIDLANNVDTAWQWVTASYDPNEKTVTPVGIGTNGLVDTGNVFTYTVFFQNTGNDTAFTVVVRDTLDADLDLNTFQFIASSHPVVVDLKPQRALSFEFANILLPDSNTNEPLSHGFLQYSIEPKETAPYGTQLKNTAFIYFDFNAPIVTNTTLNTLGVPTGIDRVEANPSFVLFPNPTSGSVTIRTATPLSTKAFVQVTDITGRDVLSLPLAEPELTFDCNALATGLYVVRLHDGHGASRSQKLAVIR